MELLEQIKNRRSIRRYNGEPVEREKLKKIVEAGLYAPNAGGRQSAKIIMLQNRELIERIGVVNAACENRNWSSGVSADQPSIIDDLNIKSGFYGCPALGIICVPAGHITSINGIGNAFVCAENMVMEAYDLGVSSVIVGRAVRTFETEEMHSYLKEWGLEEEYQPVVFVCLGYIQGEYPKGKARKEGRSIFVE